MKKYEYIIVCSKKKKKKHWYKIKVFKCDWNSQEYVNCNTLKKFGTPHTTPHTILIHDKMRKKRMQATGSFRSYKKKWRRKKRKI